MECLNISIKGIIQGVGFRPFIYNLANSLSIKGFVANTTDGVVMTVEGADLHFFIEKVRKEAPPLARIMSIDISPVKPAGFTDFSIRESDGTGRFTLLSPDVSVCNDCLDELLDRKDRRFLYPFINCTNCGPRYSITKTVPYDRANTTMKVFEMCGECLAEYRAPGNRRFHAQPNACHRCGPQLELIIPGADGKITDEKMREKDGAVKRTQDLLRQGKIVAIKGLGGFHIACDATNNKAVSKLRERKRRSNKPFALMAPDIETIRKYCAVSAAEEEVLLSHNRPIVLLRKREGLALPEAIAPNNRHIGFMLPYTPLHYLLFCHPDQDRINSDSEEFINEPPSPSPSPSRGEGCNISPSLLETATFGERMLSPFFPPPLRGGDEGEGDECGVNDRISNRRQLSVLVMTSGNISEEPIIHDNEECCLKLSPIADAFLLHNRDIFMRVDDSVVKVAEQGQAAKSAPTLFFIRRSRGYVPVPILLSEDGPDVLGCGADLKNTFTITKGSYAIPSQHIGDMENYETLRFFEESLVNLKSVYRAEPEAIGHDMHPEYMSTRWALGAGAQGSNKAARIVGIQHHYAHIGSVMAENGFREKVIGVAFDGSGYGEDGSLWGGEFLLADIAGYERAGHIKYTPLPGGEMAAREPWRMAVSYLKEAAEDEVLDFINPTGFIEKYGKDAVEKILKIASVRKFSPLSSSAGRLFDAVSALMGICDRNTFEGEAAIAIESMVIEGMREDYPVDIRFRDPIEIDFSSVILKIIGDMEMRTDKRVIATKFHNTVASSIIFVVLKLSLVNNIKKVVLSGGVFQNSYLLGKVIDELRREGLSVYVNELVPCNDAGISLGQAYIVRERIKAGLL